MTVNLMFTFFQFLYFTKSQIKESQKKVKKQKQPHFYSEDEDVSLPVREALSIQKNVWIMEFQAL